MGTQIIIGRPAEPPPAEMSVEEALSLALKCLNQKMLEIKPYTRLGQLPRGTRLTRMQQQANAQYDQLLRAKVVLIDHRDKLQIEKNLSNLNIQLPGD